MIDIKFYENVFGLKQRIMGEESFDRKSLMDKLEGYRSKEPVVYNIETTNACNMGCEMCPRTTMMTRKVKTLDMNTFKRVVDQLRPWSIEEWGTWQSFVEKAYGINRDSMSENHFFLHVIPKVIVLHGYGAPLLDKKMAERVRNLTDREIPSYFSCNPSNIGIRGIDRDLEIFERGLSYIKYSVESTDDKTHKAVRGDASDFTRSYEKILKILEEKERRGLETIVVITMLDLNRPNQQQDWQRLQKAFEGKEVYIYLKSRDQQWYEGKDEGTNSIHWTEPCQFPWSSMTIKSNGEAAMCSEDFNNELILGDSKNESLYGIWNDKKYAEFRKDHFNLKPGIKCTEQCDMKLIGKYLNKI